MDTSIILDIVRQRIGQAISEIGGEAPLYSDEFLLSIIRTINYHLLVLGVVTGTTVNLVTKQVVPDVSIPIGMLLASAAAASLIRDDLLSRLRRGELGVSFSTGATSISTNQAAISLSSQAQALDRWHQLLLTAYLSGDPNSVIQRADSVGLAF